MNFSISREYWFSAAHRIEGHPKCGRLHGHNYQVIVTVEGDSLPTSGMLIDYGVMDKIVKPIIDEMDHRYIASQSNWAADDPYAGIARQNGHAFLLDAPASTGEYLAAYLWDRILKRLWESEFTLTRQELIVMVSETPKSTATFSTK